MNTRLLMAASSIFLGLSGLALNFLPREILAASGHPSSPALAALLQVAGCSLLGWAMLNWYARGFVLGGIYARPVTLGNLMHFLGAALAIGKTALAHGPAGVLLPLFLAYALFAAAFGYLVFGRGSACVASPDGER